MEAKAASFLTSGEPVLVARSDCRALMRALAEASIDAVVTDPPYGLEFMGQDWDRLDSEAQGISFGSAASEELWTGRDKGEDRLGKASSPFIAAGVNRYVGGATAQAWHLEWAREAFRVLKPGGHLLAFGGTRTYHRLVCALEDAGFEIRDTINWVYSSGFPKSLNLAMAIDKANGAPDRAARFASAGGLSEGAGEMGTPERALGSWIPQSPEATRWNGWGTALKPAHEPIVVARKPLIGTVAENVLQQGVGALNIGATRVAFAGTSDRNEAEQKNRHAEFESGPRENQVYGADDRPRGEKGNWAPPGRWPPNLVLTHAPACRQKGRATVGSSYWTYGKGAAVGDNSPVYGGGWKENRAPTPEGRQPTESVEIWECVEGCPVRELDRQSPESSQTARILNDSTEPAEDRPDFALGPGERLIPYEDEGHASRFFPTFSWDTEEASLIYEPKAARGEREEGLYDGEGIQGRTYDSKPGFRCAKCGRWKVSGNPCVCPEPEFVATRFERPLVRNPHPTVKPIALMRWLIRLVTPPGGTVLDPFTGSGSTGCAAMLERVRFLGVEADPKYAKIAEARIAYWRPKDPSRGPDNPLLRRADKTRQVKLDGFD